MTKTAPSPTGLQALVPWARRLVWALPVWAVLLGISTLTHQPGYDADFPGYAAYITTDEFLASHLVASILGGALGIVGAFALVVLIAETPAARTALGGLVAFSVGQVLSTAVFGVAAFFQPAIGEAFLRGNETVARAINENVYGPELFALAAVGLLLWIFGLVQLGRAIRRAGDVTAGSGLAFAIAAAVFAIAGFSFELMQPVAGFALAAAAASAASRITSRSKTSSPGQESAGWEPVGGAAV